MSRNDERKTTANAVIVRLDANMNPTVEEITVEVPYTRVAAKAAASIREMLNLGAMDSVMVKEPLVQQEYERRVYSPAEVYATANYRGRVYFLDDDGTDNAAPADVLDCKRVVVEVFDYSIVCMVQMKDSGYRAMRVRAYNVTECRSGLDQFKAYASDVLEGKRYGLITVYNTDGTTSDVNADDIDFYRVAAWDTESRIRRSFRAACYLTDEELSRIPFTVYRRGEDNDTDK